MKALNEWKGIGRLGRDPETKFMPNGRAVTELSMACDYTWKDKDGQTQTETNWIPVIAFGKPAELLGQFARKGNRVYIDGRFKTDKWEGSDGITRYYTKIYMNNFIVLENKPNAEQYREESRTTVEGSPVVSRPESNKPPMSGSDFDDDIPF